MSIEYKSINPATEEEFGTFPTATDAEAQQALKRAHDAFGPWRVLSFNTRAKHQLDVANILEAKAEELADLMAREMGKPKSEGVGEAKKCAWVCRYYAENAEKLLQPIPHESDASESYVRHDALGPILAIMPWNFPLWQLYRFAAASLMVGNTVILKHAPNVPQCANAIEEIMRSAGYPEGVFQNLRLTNEQAADMIADPHLRGVTLTGSTRAGKAVAGQAGAHLKTSVMELGGSDPFIILPDADLEEAAKMGAGSRCLNNGQSCIAAKRFLVHDDVRDKFTGLLQAEMAGRVMGDPLGDGVTLGPLARKDLRDQLADQVERSKSAGAKALIGGETSDREGWFYPTTILTNVEPGSPAWTEEFFGPVAIMIGFKDDKELLEIANGTDYGLGASLWTESKERADELIPQIDAGAVFVNGMVKSDPRLPFGGVKDSGFGRELAREGLTEFVNVKTVWVK